MKTFKINGKTYIAKEFDFNLVCDFEDLGYQMSEISKKPTSAVRAYFALCADMPIDDAGKEIEKHIIAGGSLSAIMKAMSDEMTASDFFQALSATTAKSNQQTQG